MLWERAHKATHLSICHKFHMHAHTSIRARSIKKTHINYLKAKYVD